MHRKYNEADTQRTFSSIFSESQNTSKVSTKLLRNFIYNRLALNTLLSKSFRMKRGVRHDRYSTVRDMQQVYSHNVHAVIHPLAVAADDNRV